MTEAEAKTKWCPMYRSSTNDNRPWVWNPGGQPSGEISMRAAGCIGSACAWWRWSKQTQAIDGTWNVHRTKRRDGFTSLERDGFCGPAGKP